MRFLFILLASLLTMGIHAQEKIEDMKYVEVTGVAEMEIIPNEIYLRITLQEEKDGQKRSVEEQEKILINELKKADVDIKNLKLNNVGSYTHWNKKDKTSYKQKSFELLLTSAAKASEVMYRLQDLAIYNMHVSRTAHSDIEEYRKDVKINAVKAAKEKATYLLAAVDEKVGEVIFIKEQENNYYHSGYSNVMLSAAPMATDEAYQPNPDVQFKPITLKYKIIARFAIK